MNAEKKCSKCGETKALLEFGKCNRVKSGLRSWCKICHKEDTRRWKAEHPDRVRELRKYWKAEVENPEKRRERARNAYAKNPERGRAYSRKWYAANLDKARGIVRLSSAKIRSTPKGRLSFNVRRLVWGALKGKKAGRDWESLVGFTVDQLKRHLEKQFKPGMTWENYGTLWEIDHKIPTAAFNFEIPEDLDFKRCWSLKNLQPLEVQRNRMKSNKTERPFQPSLTI